eukprot:g44784.t1
MAPPLTYFPVQIGVKQGCVNAPTQFSIYLAAMLHLTADKIIELQYADDAGVYAISKDVFQTIINTFTEAYESTGVTLNISKTKVFHQPGLALWSKLLIIKVLGEALENVNYLQYLRSVLLAKAAIDEEIQHSIQCASATFGHLRQRVFKNNNIRSYSKIIVYRAVVVPALLYGSEMPRKSAGKKDAPTQGIFDQANIPSIKAVTILDRLQWARHSSHMTDARLPKRVLYSQLRNGRQTP